MTRILTCGYETGDVNEAAGVTTTGASGVVALVTATPSPRAGGSYCLKTSGAAANGNAYRSLLFTSKAEVWIRFGVWIHPLAFTTETAFAALYDSAGGNQACLTFAGSDFRIKARTQNTSSGALLGTSSNTMSVDAWHLIDWRHQMTNATTGITEVWLDGTRVINFSGDNTNTTTINVASLALGLTSLATTAGYYQAFDDVAINETTASTPNNARIGDGRVVLLKPSGAGSTTNQTRGGTDSGANWSQVDELPVSLTDYVYSATPGTLDTYVLTDLPAGTWAVNCCELVAYAQNSDAGVGSLGLTVKSGSTTNEGSAQSLGTSASYVRQLYETDPATSAAWQASAINGLEAGTTVR